MIKKFSEEASINNLGSVQYDRTQKYMSEKDKAQARENIGLGDVIKHELEEILFANLPIAEKTLRFSFGDMNYDPTTAPSVGTVSPKGAHNGTWTKLTTHNSNIWDYTVAGNSLSKEWNGGTAVDGNCFNDVENNPIKIINSDLTGITVIDRFLQRSYGITEIWKLDVSNVTGSTAYLFSQLRNCEVFPDTIDFSNNTSSDWFMGCFQACFKMKRAPKLITTGAHTSDGAFAFAHCHALSYIPYFDMSFLTQMNNFMVDCYSLTNDSISELDFSEIPDAVTRGDLLFGGITHLDTLPTGFQISKFTVVEGLGYVDIALPSYDAFPPSYASFKYLPDLTINADSIADIFRGNLNLKVIPNITAPNITTCANAFRDCKNIEAGMLRLYSYLKSLGAQITDHTGCFENCGIDTESGRIERKYIPQSWGGDGPEE